MTTEMTEFLVHLTRDHIDRGEPGECLTCPVALAISEATGLVAWVVPAMIVLFGEDGREIWRFHTPAAVRTLIERFDEMMPIEPTSFPIRVPSHLLPSSRPDPDPGPDPEPDEATP